MSRSLQFRVHPLTWLPWLLVAGLSASCRPEPKATLSAVPPVTEPGKPVVINVMVLNPGNFAQFRWSSPVGSFYPESSPKTYSTFTPSGVGLAPVSLSVSDSHGKLLFTASTAVEVRPSGSSAVIEPAAQKPASIRVVLPSVEITSVDLPYDPTGGSASSTLIEGRVHAADLTELRLVLFVRTDSYYIQPLINQPFTRIEPSGSFSARIHTGTSYAALLVDRSFEPQAQLDALPSPETNAAVKAKTEKSGKKSDSPASLQPPPIMKSIHRLACSLLVALSAITCTRAAEGEKPSIEILQAPNLAPGPDRTAPISGKVSGVKPNGARVIIYALGDRYYVQPWTAASVTEIAKDLTFKNTTHGGDQYLALLVKPSFKAPATLSAPPEVGGDVLAITTKAPRKE